ncbi:hypothetical protein K9L97_03605 [Candidatus Woesearchaeota archaeon]|nr:hypothetical protein [Candidatus Woesearchaeota archaeon]
MLELEGTIKKNLEDLLVIGSPLYYTDENEKIGKSAVFVSTEDDLKLNTEVITGNTPSEDNEKILVKVKYSDIVEGKILKKNVKKQILLAPKAYNEDYSFKHLPNKTATYEMSNVICELSDDIIRGDKFYFLKNSMNKPTKKLVKLKKGFNINKIIGLYLENLLDFFKDKNVVQPQPQKLLNYIIESFLPVSGIENLKESIEKKQRSKTLLNFSEFFQTQTHSVDDNYILKSIKREKQSQESIPLYEELKNEDLYSTMQFVKLLPEIIKNTDFIRRNIDIGISLSEKSQEIEEKVYSFKEDIFSQYNEKINIFESISNQFENKENYKPELASFKEEINYVAETILKIKKFPFLKTKYFTPEFIEKNLEDLVSETNKFNIIKRFVDKTYSFDKLVEKINYNLGFNVDEKKDAWNEYQRISGKIKEIEESESQEKINTAEIKKIFLREAHTLLKEAYSEDIFYSIDDSMIYEINRVRVEIGYSDLNEKNMNEIIDEYSRKDIGNAQEFCFRVVNIRDYLRTKMSEDKEKHFVSIKEKTETIRKVMEQKGSSLEPYSYFANLHEIKRQVVNLYKFFNYSEKEKSELFENDMEKQTKKLAYFILKSDPDKQGTLYKTQLASWKSNIFERFEEFKAQKNTSELLETDVVHANLAAKDLIEATTNYINKLDQNIEEVIPENLTSCENKFYSIIDKVKGIADRKLELLEETNSAFNNVQSVLQTIYDVVQTRNSKAIIEYKVGKLLNNLGYELKRVKK